MMEENESWEVEDLTTELRSASLDAWEALRAAARAVEADGHGSWQGGPENPGDPSFQMPWVDYSQASLDLLRALSGVGAVVPFNWMDWDGAARYTEPAQVRGIDVDEAVRLATAIVRSDRFSEGSVLAALERGVLQAVVARLLEWHDDASS